MCSIGMDPYTFDLAERRRVLVERPVRPHQHEAVAELLPIGLSDLRPDEGRDRIARLRELKQLDIGQALALSG